MSSLFSSYLKLCSLILVLLVSFPDKFEASTLYAIPNHNVNNSAHNNGSHNLIVGTPSWSDRVLFNYYLHVPRRYNQVIRQKIVYPHPGYRANSTITAIQCWDQKKDGTGAHVIVQAGGVGRNNVTFEFVSQRSHGIKFVIKIFGK